MHDLGYFREHLGQFEQMARNRGIQLDLSGFSALDHDRRESITAVERLKAERNKASDEIARRKRAGEDAVRVARGNEARVRRNCQSRYTRHRT